MSSEMPVVVLPPLAKKEVARRLSISVRTLERLIADGKFPKPLQLSKRRVGFTEFDYQAYVQKLETERRAAR